MVIGHVTVLLQFIDSLVMSNLAEFFEGNGRSRQIREYLGLYPMVYHYWSHFESKQIGFYCEESQEINRSVISQFSHSLIE